MSEEFQRGALFHVPPIGGGTVEHGRPKRNTEQNEQDREPSAKALAEKALQRCSRVEQKVEQGRNKSVPPPPTPGTPRWNKESRLSAASQRGPLRGLPSPRGRRRSGPGLRGMRCGKREIMRPPTYLDPNRWLEWTPSAKVPEVPEGSEDDTGTSAPGHRCDRCQDLEAQGVPVLACGECGAEV